ncbi:hypothetical protein EDB83DRAFT_2435051 [Lactarius deliciosus]|nr:hypothetical protein EDB83DRAFT_2435051 [Lactarius deliciosus]
MLLLSVLALALAESHCTGTARGGQRSGTYVPRRTSPDDSGIGGDGDSLVPIPARRVWRSLVEPVEYAIAVVVSLVRSG